MAEVQVSMTELRQNLGELFNRAAFGDDLIVLVSQGKVNPSNCIDTNFGLKLVLREPDSLTLGNVAPTTDDDHCADPVAL